MRPGSKNVFAETHVDTARTAAELPLCLSALALSSLWFLYMTHATAPRNCYRYKLPFLPIG